MGCSHGTGLRMSVAQSFSPPHPSWTADETLLQLSMFFLFFVLFVFSTRAERKLQVNSITVMLGCQSPDSTKND